MYKTYRGIGDLASTLGRVTVQSIQRNYGVTNYFILIQWFISYAMEGLEIWIVGENEAMWRIVWGHTFILNFKSAKSSVY